MTPSKVRKYKKEYAEELLRIAQSDLDAGHAIQAARSGRAENLAYFAEQVVEKSLKAVLCIREIAFPATHDLRQLIDLMGPSDVPPHGDALGELTIYGAVRRYEEGPWSLSWEEADLALSAAKDVLAWALACKG
ncbi:MAG: HEPN domain-containing protein [Deltaproteobacteria bacterium]|nr:HEPN domain-containing protein [Deltaproteobacteria bacterium]